MSVEKDPVLAAMEEALDLAPKNSGPETQTKQNESDQDGAVAAGPDPGPESAVDPEASEPDPSAEWKAKLEEAERAKRGVLSELQEERRARRQREEETQKLLDALREQREEEDAARRKAEVEASTPAPDEDPVGHLKATLSRELTEKIGQLDSKIETVTQYQERMRQEEEFRQVQEHNAGLEESFRKEKPDYDDALKFMREWGANTLRTAKPDITDQELAERVRYADYQMVMGALRSGQNPAEVAYGFAAQMGYKPSANGGEAGTPAGAHNPAPAGSTPAPATTPGKPRVPSLSATSGVAGGGRRKITRQEYIALDINDPLYTAIASDPRLNREMGVKGEVWL